MIRGPHPTVMPPWSTVLIQPRAVLVWGAVVVTHSHAPPPIPCHGRCWAGWWGRAAVVPGVPSNVAPEIVLATCCTLIQTGLVVPAYKISRGEFYETLCTWAEPWLIGWYLLTAHPSAQKGPSSDQQIKISPNQDQYQRTFFSFSFTKLPQYCSCKH